MRQGHENLGAQAGPPSSFLVLLDQRILSNGPEAEVNAAGIAVKEFWAEWMVSWGPSAILWMLVQSSRSWVELELSTVVMLLVPASMTPSLSAGRGPPKIQSFQL